MRRRISLHEATVDQESVYAAAAYEDDTLVAFAYGHPWQWREQRDPWAAELKQRPGAAAATIDGCWALNMLARHPSAHGTGLGARTLSTWLAEVGRLGRSGVWLQTTDIDSPDTGRTVA